MLKAADIMQDYVIYYYDNTVFGVQLKKRCFDTKQELSSFIEGKLYKEIDEVYIHGKRFLLNVETKIKFTEI